MFMPDLTRRNLVPEIMDRSDLPEQRHRHALAGLARINWLSGVVGTLWSVLRPMAIDGTRPFRVLDVACGGGDVAIGLWKRAQREHAALEILGIDISPTAISFARQRACNADASVRFEIADASVDSCPFDADAAISSLFLHHLDGHSAVDMVARMAASCSRILIVSDLRRCRAGYLTAQLACRTLTRSPVVRVDGPRSVAGAFREGELAAVFQTAGLSGAMIQRVWPFRMLGIWRRP